jgi:hypothetical protein
MNAEMEVEVGETLLGQQKKIAKLSLPQIAFLKAWLF